MRKNIINTIEKNYRRHEGMEKKITRKDIKNLLKNVLTVKGVFLGRCGIPLKGAANIILLKTLMIFFDHWLEQKKIYGMKCPGTGVEMTTKAFFNKKGEFKTCPTNISKDRILSSMGYSRQNLIFTCWKYNNAKGSMTPQMAKAFLKIVKERYGTDKIE